MCLKESSTVNRTFNCPNILYISSRVLTLLLYTLQIQITRESLASMVRLSISGSEALGFSHWEKQWSSMGEGDL